MKLLKPDIMIEMDSAERHELCAAIGLAVSFFEECSRGSEPDTAAAYSMQEAFVTLERLWSVLRK